jgi:hypothetical protein
VTLEVSVYSHCCPGGCGEAGGAAKGSWRQWKEGRALRVEGVWMGVRGEVEWCVWEVGAVGEG